MPVNLPPQRRSKERELTGRHVLLMLLGFFGFVTLVNIAMIQAAISTFGGVDTPSSYQAGLRFATEQAAAAAQRELAWAVEANVARTEGGPSMVTIAVRDAHGAPIRGADVSVRFAHPADQRRDLVVSVTEDAPGIYSGATQATAGQWLLITEIGRDGLRRFRSENRVVVR